jgi:hypothetical protein
VFFQNLVSSFYENIFNVFFILAQILKLSIFCTGTVKGWFVVQYTFLLCQKAVNRGIVTALEETGKSLLQSFIQDFCSRGVLFLGEGVTKNLKNVKKFVYVHFFSVFTNGQKFREGFKPPNPPGYGFFRVRFRVHLLINVVCLRYKFDGAQINIVTTQWSF